MSSKMLFIKSLSFQLFTKNTDHDCLKLPTWCFASQWCESTNLVCHKWLYYRLSTHSNLQHFPTESEIPATIKSTLKYIQSNTTLICLMKTTLSDYFIPLLHNWWAVVKTINTKWAHSSTHSNVLKLFRLYQKMRNDWSTVTKYCRMY